MTSDGCPARVCLERPTGKGLSFILHRGLMYFT